MRLTHRLAAHAIRRHLWQPGTPGPLGGRPWTMARELQIFDRLARHTDALELIGAIAHVRAIAGTRGPIRLTWLIHRQRGQALLSRAVAAFYAERVALAPESIQGDAHASEPTQAPPGPPRGGGFARLSVELP